MDSDDRIRILFMLLSVGLLTLTYAYITLPDAVECELRTTKGAVLTGNCDELYRLKYEGTTLTGMLNRTEEEELTCPPCICDNPPPCPEMTPCPPCRQRDCVCTCEVCTVCPLCECEMSESIKHELLNMRYPGGGAACVSHGYHECLMDVWDLLELKDRPKFKITTTRKADFYREVSGVGAQTSNDGLFCFKDLGGYFIINRTLNQQNRSMWGWNDDSCKSSAIRINDL